MFWRGYDVHDQAKAGLISDGPEAQRIGTWLDTTSKGGSNRGQEFGTGLSGPEKDTLVEYLKTL